MTEIPEHLLKRSQQRRAAASGESAETGAASTSPATVDPATAVAKAAAPAKAQAPAAPPPPKPDPAYVAAAKNRKKIPFWAMATLSLLPIWGFMYMQGVKPQAKTLSGPLGEGTEVYRSCSSCHGAAGEGGAGRQLNQGEVLITFPHIEDQLNFVYNGSAGFQLAGVNQYGDPDRAGGARVPGSFGAVMAGQSLDKGGSYTDAQIPGCSLSRALRLPGRRRSHRPEVGEGIRTVVFARSTDVHRAGRGRDLRDPGREVC